MCVHMPCGGFYLRLGFLWWLRAEKNYGSRLPLQFHWRSPELADADSGLPFGTRIKGFDGWTIVVQALSSNA